jgi:SAM-dependent methyltransferase
VPKKVPRRVRSRVFGRDPGTYDRVRLAYPRRVYEVLTTRCGLVPGAHVLEIGPGTGIATRELLRLGANPLTVVEPDRRLARYLVSTLGARAGRVAVQVLPFERARLPTATFDVGVAATSFHWLPERRALRKVARALRPGGWWASWSNHHGDPYRRSPFHRALQPLYAELRGRRPGIGPSRATAAKDRRERLLALRSTGAFERVSREDIHWSVTLGTARVGKLWGTFSDIVTLPASRRRWFLAELERIVEDRFGGEVTFPMLTPLYTARRV